MDFNTIIPKEMMEEWQSPPMKGLQEALEKWLKDAVPTPHSTEESPADAYDRAMKGIK